MEEVIMRKLMVLCFMIVCISFAGSAFASSIGVTYTKSGTPGNYLLDFTVTNNIPASYGQHVYFWGVDLPYSGAQGSPANWFYPTWDANWSNQGNGGSSIHYQSLWINESYNELASGNSLSGFTVPVSTIPQTINFFAFGVGQSYYGSDAFRPGWNPGFEGIVSSGGNGSAPVPEPCTMILLGSGLLGLAGLRKKIR